MSHTRDLLSGLRAELTTAGIAAPIFYKDMPTGPDQAVALTAYASMDEAKVALSHLRVQVWFRGRPDKSLDPDDMADEVFDILQGLEDRWYGPIHLVQCYRASAVPLGVDGSKRTERTDNYEIDVDFPLTAGRPF